MTRKEIIRSLKDQAKDKLYQANGDPESIFANDAEALVAAADVLEADAPKWVSVKCRLPKPGITKMFVTIRHEHGSIVDMARYLGGKEGWDLATWKIWDNNVTHWMPLPEPPKED